MNPHPPTPEGPLRIGVGLIRRGDRFLIRQRPVGAAMPGYWEFPGGKSEPGESAEAATRRECLEETGLAVAVGRLRKVIAHRYSHAWVEVFYYDCETLEADAEPAPSSGFRWVVARILPALVFPEANRPVLDELAIEFDPH